ncbi:MAG: hypothetical protein H6990_11125 [Pseudomonadales bacterium]|nr:hypothetical protein [Pseudomonadales bacterium]
MAWLSLWLLPGITLIASPTLLAGQAVTTATSAAPAPAAATVLQWKPGMSLNSLTGRLDSDFVEFNANSRMRVGDLRRLDAAAKRMRAASSTPAPPSGLREPPASGGERVNNASELAAALRRNGDDRIQLPSGENLTVDQLRFLKPEVEQRLGRKLSAEPRAPALSGPALKVPRGISAEEWRKLLQKPDSTVLESPSGKRVTVGEIKQLLADSGDRRTAVDRAAGAPR